MATLGGNLLQRPGAGIPRRQRLLAMKDGKSLVRERRQSLSRHLHDRWRRALRQPLQPGRPLIALGAQATIKGPKGERTVTSQICTRFPEPTTTAS